MSVRVPKDLEPEHHQVTIDLLAGIPVRDYTAAAAWYEQLICAPPSFLPDDTEAVWELAEHRYLCMEIRPQHAAPTASATATFRDPDGNEIGFGGAPISPQNEAAPPAHPDTASCTSCLQVPLARPRRGAISTR